jgi:hypothetical protein
MGGVLRSETGLADGSAICAKGKEQSGEVARTVAKIRAGLLAFMALPLPISARLAA